MNSIAHRLAAAIALACLGLAACSSDPREGYSFSSSFDSSITTVHVPIFRNPTFSRGLEVELTDAVIKEIQRTTPWQVVPASMAQTTLSGTLTDSELRKLSTGRTSGLAQELAVILTVDFEFTDNRSGKTIVSRRNFEASESFVPAQGANERIEVGQNAAVQRLARDIVAQLRAEW